MDITLSWDLFIIVFMALVLAYSFIVGRQQTLKIIIATYMSFLAADGLSYFIANTVGFNLPARALGFNPDAAAIIVTILLFILFVVILSRHHAFDVNVEDTGADIPYIITTTAAAVMSAVLMVSAILFFLSGNSLTVIDQPTSTNSILLLAQKSEIASSLVDYFYVSFFLPALTLVGISMFENRRT